jgi:hypothetical protein
MSTAGISSTSTNLQAQVYFQQRNVDQKALGQALKSGDLATAQQEFNALQTLGQSGPFASGDAYSLSQRQQDFTAIGQALESGDLAGAQQAFSELKSTFPHHAVDPQPPSGPVDPGAPSGPADPTSVPSTTQSSRPEVILNLGSLAGGELITIGVRGAAKGSEKVSISLASQQNQSPEQITINLSQNSNEKIVLNLFTDPGSPQGNGLNLTA